MRSIIFVALLLLIVLTSCSARVASSQPTMNTSSTKVVIQPTSTQAYTPKPLATTTLTASETPSLPIDHAFKIVNSPSGEFVAKAYFENDHPSGKQTIEIQNKDGKIIWQIPYQGEMSTSYPRPSLDIFQWSSDSSQLYFYYAFSPDGGDRAFWWTGFDLQKFDIKTGDIQYVLPGKGFMSFAISPDGTQIAYTRQQDNPSIIYIRSLSTSSEKAAYVIFASKNYSRVGDIHWSSTGKELAFQTETDDGMVQTIYLNLSTVKQKVIREYMLFTMEFQGWTDDGELEFIEYGNIFSQIVHVNTKNNETIIIGTTTPSP